LLAVTAFSSERGVTSLAYLPGVGGKGGQSFHSHS
jgi:hypothetical protein